jgi:hypothetical protein
MMALSGNTREELSEMKNILLGMNKKTSSPRRKTHRLTKESEAALSSSNDEKIMTSHGTACANTRPNAITEVDLIIATDGSVLFGVGYHSWILATETEDILLAGGGPDCFCCCYYCCHCGRWSGFCCSHSWSCCCLYSCFCSDCWGQYC